MPADTRRGVRRPLGATVARARRVRVADARSAAGRTAMLEHTRATSAMAKGCRVGDGWGGGWWWVSALPLSQKLFQPNSPGL
eukprot:986007-Prorocentrum_minimum.AAC.5